MNRNWIWLFFLLLQTVTIGVLLTSLFRSRDALEALQQANDDAQAKLEEFIRQHAQARLQNGSSAGGPARPGVQISHEYDQESTDQTWVHCLSGDDGWSEESRTTMGKVAEALGLIEYDEFEVMDGVTRVYATKQLRRT